MAKITQMETKTSTEVVILDKKKEEREAFVHWCSPLRDEMRQLTMQGSAETIYPSAVLVLLNDHIRLS